MIRLPAFFSDGMVIGKKARLWGWTAPDSRGVTAEFLGVKYETTADCDGRFEFTFLAPEYGGPFELTVGDVTVRDVYVGRVWLCGGQSNMEGPINRCRLPLGEYVVEDTRIRMFRVETGMKFDSPAEDVNGKWLAATEDALDSMYAVPYFFARALLASEAFAEKNIPVGLLCTPAGGTSIEGWLPEEIVRDYPEIYDTFAPLKEPGFAERTMAEGEVRVRAWKDELVNNDTGLTEGWHSPVYDDSDWDERYLLSPAHQSARGAIWYRKRINLTEANGAGVLRFGRAVNSIKVYVNGTEVVSLDYMYPPCNCFLPEGALKEGENLIAVRLVGESHRPHFVSGKEYSLELSDGVRVDLSGKWKWRVGAEMPHCEPSPWYFGRPCVVYNHMLAPVLGYSVEGIAWYQGESNTGRPGDYKTLFAAFADNMRKHFGGDVPIIFTQLANFIDPNQAERTVPGEGWAQLREQQRKCLEIPNTAMAVAIDCGEWNDLHPADKKTVGERLALHARRIVYGEDIISDGPTAASAEVSGGKLTVRFTNAEGLWASNGHPLLDVVDRQGNIHRLYGVVKEETLVADIGGIQAAAVRFGWIDCPTVALYNVQGLPASPFEQAVKS